MLPPFLAGGWHHESSQHPIQPGLVCSYKTGTLAVLLQFADSHDDPSARLVRRSQHT